MTAPSNGCRQPEVSLDGLFDPLQLFFSPSGLRVLTNMGLCMCSWSCRCWHLGPVRRQLGPQASWEKSPVCWVRGKQGWNMAWTGLSCLIRIHKHGKRGKEENLMEYEVDFCAGVAFWRGCGGSGFALIQPNSPVIISLCLLFLKEKKKHCITWGLKLLW